MDGDLLVVNGLDAATGRYLVPPLAPAAVAALAQSETVDRAHLAALQDRRRRAEAHYGVKYGVDPADLSDAGWGVVFAANADPAIREALAPLLAHRRAQAAARDERRYQEYTGFAGVHPGETTLDWLVHQGAGPGPADPTRVPYYLLLIGPPEAIPYRFQYQLDVQYAVGRLALATPGEYAAYARTVVAIETGPGARPPRLVLFGVANPDDPATRLSAQELVRPLGAQVAAQHPGWIVETRIGAPATKAGLAQLLGGAQTPAVLFTASHGLGFPAGDPRQLPQQGALVCQDWPGPRAWQAPIPEDFYFAATDIGDSADIGGLVTFHFACYSAGTPQDDAFAHLAGAGPAPAAQAFIAGLPQRLLSHPRGGALAVVGHIDRAWGTSFQWPGAGGQVEVFASTVGSLLAGLPVGAAVEFFNERYAELASTLSDRLYDVQVNGRIPDDRELAGLWTATHDARGFVILGDPAVRVGSSPPPSLSGGEGVARAAEVRGDPSPLPPSVQPSTSSGPSPLRLSVQPSASAGQAPLRTTGEGRVRADRVPPAAARLVLALDEFLAAVGPDAAGGAPGDSDRALAGALAAVLRALLRRAGEPGAPPR